MSILPRDAEETMRIVFYGLIITILSYFLTWRFA